MLLVVLATEEFESTVIAIEYGFTVAVSVVLLIILLLRLTLLKVAIK